MKRAMLAVPALTGALLILGALPAHADTVSINGPDGTPSSSVTGLLAITLLSVAPALLLMVTPFVKIFTVLAITKMALGLNTVPPAQVVAALALFLSLFVMSPILIQVANDGVIPYMNGKVTFEQAWPAIEAPIKEWMLKYTRQEDIAFMLRAANLPNPENPDGLNLLTLIPAFMLSELTSAFIIGLVIFIPFLIIDLFTASALNALGFMMLPPVVISNAIKLGAFLLIGGWHVILNALLTSYQVAG